MRHNFAEQYYGGVEGTFRTRDNVLRVAALLPMEYVLRVAALLPIEYVLLVAALLPIEYVLRVPHFFS